MLPITFFDQYRQSILSLPLKKENQKYDRSELMVPDFLLFGEDNLEAYYAPFHFLNPDARIVLVGLTPGWTQMEVAFRAARQALSLGMDGQCLFEHVERIGSFSGRMRANLVEMLDGVGLNVKLGIDSCHNLFEASSKLVHFTSAVSAPIFRNGENYRGHRPAMLRSPKLRNWVAENLAMELMSITNAIIIPLGRVADDAIRFLEAQHGLRVDGCCLKGFPHPSGANGHRKEDFKRGREQWSSQLATWFHGKQ